MQIDVPTAPGTPIGRCLERWHDFLAGDLAALGEAIAEDAVLHSPVLFRPQEGKDLVVMYLTAAGTAFVGDGTASVGDGSADDGAESDATVAERSFTHPDGREWDGRFRYVRSVLGDNDAVLEFETTMGGSYVNGVDMITCDDDGLIVDFKVMVRPLRAVEAVRETMLRALESLGMAPG